MLHYLISGLSWPFFHRGSWTDCGLLSVCNSVSNRSNKLMDDKRRRSSSSTGPKDKGSSSRSAKSSSSSKAKEDKKEPPKGEDGGAGREGSGRQGEGSGREGEGVGSGDVVAGVIEGDKAEEYEGEGDQGSHDVGPSADNAEAVTEDPETAANTSLESQEDKEPAPDSDDVPSTAKVLSSSDVTEKAEGSEVSEEGTVPGPEEKAEGEPESEQMETEATTDEPETEDKDDSPSAGPAESSEMHEEQLPADQVGQQQKTFIVQENIIFVLLTSWRYSCVLFSLRLSSVEHNYLSAFSDCCPYCKHIFN